MSAALEIILGHFPSARPNGSGYIARCPAHDDKTPSLSISEKDSKVLLHCHAGCTTDAICAAAGMEMRDLFAEQATEKKVVATYDYTDEAGKLLFQAVRYRDPKDFRQRHRNGKGSWVWNINGVRRVLYNLPEVLKATDVVVVEGEKDVETAKKLGFVATTNPMGAGKWRDEYSEFLRGKNVTVVPDNDEAGRKHGEEVARSLHLRAASNKVARLPEKIKDLSEFVERGFSREALLELLAAAPAWTPDKEPANWRDMFHTVEDFENAPPLSFAAEGFLQHDAVTGIAALAGHSKTFMGLSVAKALLFGPGMLWDLFRVPKRAERVVYLIPESTITPFKHRLKLMGLYEEIRTGRLLVRTLSKGPTPKLDDPALLRAAREAYVIADTAIRFIIGDESSASEMAQGLSIELLTLSNIARAVLALFHSPKGFGKESAMTLENMIRGSGELGAVLATAWGVKQIDAASNIVHVQNLKPRDFEPCGPFQLIGRPHIDQTGDFAIHKRPEECGSLSDEQPELNRVNSGAKEARSANIELVKLWLTEDPEPTAMEMKQRFGGLKIVVSESTIRGYKHAIRKTRK